MTKGPRAVLLLLASIGTFACAGNDPAPVPDAATTEVAATEVAATVVAATTVAAAPAPHASPGDDAVVAAIDRYLASCELFGFTGAVLVAKDGNVLIEKGYGLADGGAGTANTADTRFEIASASKQFTAAAVLKLASQGKLSLDDRIARHLPGVPEAHAKVTVAHLLHHTSGFPRMGPSGQGKDLAAAVAGYLSGKRTAEPGARFEYWNGGYALLAAIVERTSGMTFADCCRNLLFEPAGMTATSFCGEPVPAPLLAHGRQSGKGAGAANAHSFGWEYRGMGGVVTTVRDLYRWDRALRGDAVLASDTRARLFEPALSKYACGWFVVDQPGLGRVAEHGGAVAGFEAEMIRCLDRDACVFVLANRRDVGWQVGYQLAGMLLGDAFEMGRAGRATPPPDLAPVSAERLARVAGRFVLPSGAAFVVRAAGGAVTVGAEGQEAVDLLAARTPDPERWRAERDVAQRLVAGVAKGDVSLVREKVVDAPWSGRWPDHLRDRYWPRHVETCGDYVGCEEIGAAPEGRNAVRVWVRLRHARRDAAAEIVLADGRLTILDLAGREFPSQAAYAQTAAGPWTSYDFGRPAPAAFTFDEGDGPEGDALRFAPAGAAGAADARVARRAAGPPK